ncbi:hypothetical protein [uncultured Kordia sp.]|uniref:hypothetical protein n=1 Tax=uncultured Kordia sp. TaxID=507699 RepID=UPI002632F452|nr:hypothetical protein [uncultured Kordia sp.]
MKSKRLANLNLAKETISQFDANAIKGRARGTQSNNELTGCHTNCTSTVSKGTQ